MSVITKNYLGVWGVYHPQNFLLGGCGGFAPHEGFGHAVFSSVQHLDICH